MCGICGVACAPRDRPSAEALEAMRDSLTHRGPDGAGGVSLGGASEAGLTGWFGHRRLKILDLSTHADQPMSSRDGLVTLTYNGEIYNFRELRRELAARGHPFESTGDTEVLLNAYREWGVRCVDRLEGMFAFAIWDAREARLVLARDRTGKKPLFYWSAGGRFAFASEIKALLQCPWVEREVDQVRLASFLVFGYVPHPDTLYRGVKQVPPACTLTFDSKGLRAPAPYWSALPDAQDALPFAKYLRQTVPLLRNAVQRRMVSDVPLGALLSGGIDSSLIVALMSELTPDPIHTFSIGFPEDASFDERGYADLVARRFSTRHTAFAVQLDAVGVLDSLIWHHDQPFGDSSAIPTYALCRLAREHVKVVLNGDGGDEIFAGYDRFAAAAMAFQLPTPAVSGARALARYLPDSSGYFSVRRRADRFLELADAPVKTRYQAWISAFRPDALAEALHSPPPDDVVGSMRRCYEEADGLSKLDQIVYANLRTYLPDDISVKMDRMSMAHSLEARSPFLDTTVIEHAARLPARTKIGLRRPKPVLRRAFGPLLPDEIWNRPKHGFGVPLGAWFRGDLGEMFADEVLAEDARSAAYLRQGYLGRLLQEHRAGAEHGARLWPVLTLERWLRSLEGLPPHAPPGDGVRDAERAPAGRGEAL